MRNVYIQVRLKPAAPVAARPITTTVSGKGKKAKIVAVPGHPGTFEATPAIEWRTVAAEDLGDACRKGEAMPDVLAVLATSFTKPE